MSKNVAYTADFDIRADFTVPLFMSSDPDIKFGDTVTMSLANMMGECLKGMYESVTVEAGSASIYLYDAGCCSPVQMLRRKKIDLEYLYSVTFSVTLPVHGAEISVFDRIDTNDEVRKEIETDLEVEFWTELTGASILQVRDYTPKVNVWLDNIHVDEGWLDDFYNHAKTVFATVWTSGIEYEHEKIDNLGKVDTRCTIVKKIEETSNGAKLYGYRDTPKSPVMKTNDLLFTSTNQEFARRLYCGVVWTHDALIFAETYYQYRD